MFAMYDCSMKKRMAVKATECFSLIVYTDKLVESFITKIEEIIASEPFTNVEFTDQS